MIRRLASSSRLRERIQASRYAVESAMIRLIQEASITLRTAFLIVSAAGLLVVAAAVQAQSAGEWRNAEHLYNSSCTFCHDTGVGPVLKGVGWPEEYIEIRVRNGYRAMPAFKPSEISRSDIEDLARWLAEQEPTTEAVEAGPGS